MCWSCSSEQNRTPSLEVCIARAVVKKKKKDSEMVMGGPHRAFRLCSENGSKGFEQK